MVRGTSCISHEHRGVSYKPPILSELGNDGSSTLSTFICASAVPQILEGLHHKSSYYSVLMVSIWDLGEALGPLVLAPSSELYGRLAALHISIVLFIISAIASAVSTNACMMIAFRFLNGVGSPYILGSAIISDIFPREQRGTAISIAGLMPLVGELFGRLIGSHTAKTLGWRWTFWIVAIIAAVLGVSLRHYMPETYAVTILEEKTMQLKKTTGNQALRSKYHKQVSAQASLRTFLRPLELLWASPMVTMLSLYLAMVNGCIYIISDTMTQVLEGTYGFSEASTRISFFGICAPLFTLVHHIGLTNRATSTWNRPGCTPLEGHPKLLPQDAISQGQRSPRKSPSPSCSRRTCDPCRNLHLRLDS